MRQIKLRAVRLNVPEDNISLVAESDVDEICGLIESMKPDLVVIDSIQTMRCTDISSSAGTVSQVKESSARFLNVAKTLEIPTFIVGPRQQAMAPSQAQKSWSISWIRCCTP